VLALEQARRFRRYPAEHLALGVNHVPPPLNGPGSGDKRTHQKNPFNLRCAPAPAPESSTGS